jgi:hypothetical protein
VNLIGGFLQLLTANGPKLYKEVRLTVHIIDVSDIHSYLFHLRTKVEDFQQAKLFLATKREREYG